MTTTTTLRDPTAETAPVRRPRRPPSKPLQTARIALLDIGKMRGDEFVDRIDKRLRALGCDTRRWRKPTNTRTAPLPILQEIATWADVVVVALSDCGSCTSCSTHDLNDLDLRGIPGVNVLTTEFRDAFDAQCAAIGFEAAAVFVPHPILNRTRAEIETIADEHFRTIIDCVTPLD